MQLHDINFRFTVANNGQAEAQNVKVKVKLENQEKEFDIGTLRAGQSVQQEGTLENLNFQRRGYYLIATIDPNNTIQETNEVNNEKRNFFNVLN